MPEVSDDGLEYTFHRLPGYPRTALQHGANGDVVAQPGIKGILLDPNMLFHYFTLYRE